MRARLLAFLLLAAVLMAIAACGDTDDESAPATEPTTSTTTTGTDGIDPLADAGTDPVIGEAAGTETALLERVAIGRHEGFDRVVFQFRDQLPGYRVEYVEPPLQEDGSGNPVEIDGDAIVLVRMEPASGFDLTAPGDGEVVYDGPRRLSGSDAGASVVREVVRTGDFEAVLTWAVGLDQRIDFRVRTLDNPPRLVVDFRNH